MKLIDVYRRQFLISFPYSASLVAELKSSFHTRKFNPEKMAWTVPVNNKNFNILLNFAARNGFSVTKALVEKTKNLVVYTDNTEQLISALESSEIYSKLRDFQREGARFLISKKKALLADACGVGKTVQSLAAVSTGSLFPSLIVVKAVLKLNWANEITKWTKDSFHVISGKKNYELPKADHYIINYDILSDWQKVITELNPAVIIFDESHCIKNNKSKRGKAAEEVAANAEYTFLLSGTPIVNRPSELIHQLKIIDRLDEFGGWQKFGMNYCAGTKTRWGWDFTGATNLVELHAKLKDTCMLRRTKEEVLKELPPKQRTDVYLEIDNRDEYNFVEAELVEWLQSQAEDDITFSLRIADLPYDKQEKEKYRREQLLEHGNVLAEQLVRIEKLKQVAVKGKLASAVNWIDNFLDSGEKLVLFCTHKQVQKYLYETFPEALTIFGTDSNEIRNKNVAQFQNNPESKLIICSIDAAAEGITLTASSNVAFLEFAWTPGKMWQAEDRCHRIGSVGECVNSYYLLGSNTVDIDIYALLAQKGKILNSVLDGSYDSTEFNTSILDDLTKVLRDK
jgi:SWI/SNF-related matrix-associated actin-dependent regulator 1 of chromatin subfamily A